MIQMKEIIKQFQGAYTYLNSVDTLGKDMAIHLAMVRVGETIPKLKDLEIALDEYHNYVMEYPDTHTEGNYPSCFDEWYENDWSEI